MRKITVPFALSLAFALSAIQANIVWAAGDERHTAHVHGTGEMEIVQDGEGLFISLYSPLYNVLGFEHTPKTDAEKVKARRITSLLRANGLFAFSPDAQCRRTGFKLYSEVLNPHSHGPADDHQHHEPSDGHSDLRAAYEFECAQPAKLKTVEVRMFRQFPGLEKIDVQALFPSGQTGASLTATNNSVSVP